MMTGIKTIPGMAIPILLIVTWLIPSLAALLLSPSLTPRIYASV